jgi:hypothetical protein
LYAFEKTASCPGALFEEVIENIVWRAFNGALAAKNFEDVQL